MVLSYTNFMKQAFLDIKKEYSQNTDQLNANTGDLAVLGKRQSELMPIVEKIDRLLEIEQQIIEAKQLIETEKDQAIIEMASEELSILENKQNSVNESLEIDLIPKDPNDDKNIILEMRAGAGGDESTLFVAELYRAYAKYIEAFNWKMSIVSSSKSDVGGFKELIIEIKGGSNANAESGGPYGIFKYESGVHRVQRVPETEKAGRVHTSTITVAVMPELEEKDFEIDMKDLEIEATTSSGHGGQSVNTTYSAIRIVHIPTGITAQCQDERSQTQNKEKAMVVIRARVSQHYLEIEQKKITDARRSQIGTGDRSEKIRTYNFPQDRVTDHRINQNFNRLPLIMEGQLEPIISALQTADLDIKKQNLTI